MSRNDPADVRFFEPEGIPAPRLRACSATTKMGNPCAQPAVMGTTVCRYHGGLVPTVSRKASLRLAALVDPAVAVLARILADPNARPADRLRAAENILDRAGLPRRTEIASDEASRALLTERLVALRDSLVAEAEAESDRLADRTIQGTVVEPEPVAPPSDSPTEETPPA